MKKKRRKEPKRCEGWRKTGAFQMGGTGRWEQCGNNAIAILEVEQDGKVTKQPSCAACWDECMERRMTILSTRPIKL